MTETTVLGSRREWRVPDRRDMERPAPHPRAGRTDGRRASHRQPDRTDVVIERWHVAEARYWRSIWTVQAYGMPGALETC